MRGTGEVFPKPLLEPQKHDDLEVSKKIKKTRYVEESIFQTWLTRGEQEIIERNDEYQLQDGLLYQKTLGSDFIFDVATIPRNTINRVTNASENIFYSSGVAMKGLGLFFMVRFMDDSYEDVLKGCLCF